MTLRIGVDGRGVVGARSGIRRFTLGLLDQVTQFSNPPEVLMLVPRTDRGGPTDVDDVRAAGVQIRPLPNSVLRAHAAATRLSVPVPINPLLPGCTVYLFPAFLRLPAVGKPTLTVIHDLTYEHFPEFIHPEYLRTLRQRATAAIQRSDVIITPSRTVASEIAAAHPEAKHRLLALPPGGGISPGLPQARDPETLATIGVPPTFFLHVGTLEPRKNLVRALEAVRLLPSEVSATYPLVLAGSRGWSDRALRRHVQALGDRVIHVVSPTDSELAVLYRNARSLFFPSRYEGFGLPLLEAMSCDLPIACSDIAVFREVAWDAAVFFDPLRATDMRDALLEVLTNEPLRQQLIGIGRERLRAFSWSRSAENLLARIACMPPRRPPGFTP